MFELLHRGEFEIARGELETAIVPVANFFKKKPYAIVSQLSCDRGEGKHWIDSDHHYKEGNNLAIEEGLELKIIRSDARGATDIIWLTDDGKILSVIRQTAERYPDAVLSGKRKELKGRSKLETMQLFTQYLKEYNSWH